MPTLLVDAEREATPHSVLAYLWSVVERCRRAHRSDLERDYYQAWAFYSDVVYGPLPPRPQWQSVYTQWPAPTKPTPSPRWKIEKYSNPLRRVVARDGEDEILECGHRHWWPENLSEKPARRRRCAHCSSLLATDSPKAPAAEGKTETPKRKAAHA